MEYFVNSASLAQNLIIPMAVVEKHLKLASATQLKVLLFSFKNIAAAVNVDETADFLKLPPSEVEDALEYWAQAGILNRSGAASAAAPAPDKKKAVRSAAVKPTREEVSSVAVSDSKLAFLLQEAEMKLSRTLRSNEMQTLAWLYLDHGMDVSLILMLVEYAVSEEKATVSFIESTALSWLDAGVTTLSDAEARIEERNRKKTAWGLVQSAFGMERRSPSDKELEFAAKWSDEWGFGKAMLKEAYNRCVDQKAKLDMRYINGILERWFRNGITSPEDLPKEKAKSGGDGMGVYDKKLVDKLLNQDD